jgi:hypothetical protein
MFLDITSTFFFFQKRLSLTPLSSMVYLEFCIFYRKFCKLALFWPQKLRIALGFFKYIIEICFRRVFFLKIVSRITKNTDFASFRPLKPPVFVFSWNDSRRIHFIWPKSTDILKGKIRKIYVECFRSCQCGLIGLIGGFVYTSCEIQESIDFIINNE